MWLCYRATQTFALIISASFSIFLRSKLSTYTKPFPRHNTMPTQPVQPLRMPVKLTFPDGTELTSSFDPVTNMHSVYCDLCGKFNQLGPRGAGNSIFQHRDSEGCKNQAIRQMKQAAKERLKVSHICYDQLDFDPDLCEIRLEGPH